MNSYGINTDNLLRVLPDVLRNDENMRALATSIADELSQLSADTDKARLYADIDNLPEDVLDTLAKDFKVDWWSGDYSVAEKRQTLKDSWYVHRHLGTKSAVARAMSAVYYDTEVLEWYEYGGQPFHFKIMIMADPASVDPAKHATVVSLADYYKNLRSVMDPVEYSASGGVAETFANASFVGCEIVDGATAVNY